MQIPLILLFLTACLAKGFDNGNPSADDTIEPSIVEFLNTHCRPETASEVVDKLNIFLTAKKDPELTEFFQQEGYLYKDLSIQTFHGKSNLLRPGPNRPPEGYLTILRNIQYDIMKDFQSHRPILVQQLKSGEFQATWNSLPRVPASFKASPSMYYFLYRLRGLCIAGAEPVLDGPTFFKLFQMSPLVNDYMMRQILTTTHPAVIQGYNELRRRSQGPGSPNSNGGSPSKRRMLGARQPVNLDPPSDDDTMSPEESFQAYRRYRTRDQLPSVSREPGKRKRFSSV